MCLAKKAEKRSGETVLEVAEQPILPQNSPPHEISRGRAMFEPWLNRCLEMGVASLIEEFRSLSKWTPEGVTKKAFQANRDKNRYTDVICHDETRVILQNLPSNDYIHANYIGTPSQPHRFICSQGPLDSTSHAFWAAVIQEGVECILMLCKCIEMGRHKCSQYWPESVGDIMTFGTIEDMPIQVSNIGVTTYEQKIGLTVTALKLDWIDGSRVVKHYQWNNWPDHGVPKDTETVIELLSATRGSKYPILVHCSAGIGRTGSIVAVALVLEKMAAEQECTSMDEILKELRAQRLGSIQNELQYLFVHRVLLYYFLDRHKEQYQELLEGETGEKYQKWLEDYDKFTGMK